MTQNILIVDDEEDIRMLIAGLLEDEGYVTHEAATDKQVFDAFEKQKPDLVIQDIWLEGSTKDGLEILKETKKLDPDLPVIMISGHGTIEMAVKALHSGAYDFIEKPFKSDRLLIMVKRALEAVNLRRENRHLRQRQDGMENLKLNGKSAKIRQVQHTIERVAPTESRVLVTGAPGTGKELAARMIHQCSPRADKPFIVLNCALMTPERMDEELFGLEENGKILKNGLLEQAHEGSLFLDEVADMPLETQGKILHVLTDQSFSRIGGIERIDVNARIIAASSQDLQQRIRDGEFREDLYYRLNVVPLHMPRLGERRDDIPELIDHFTKDIAKHNGLRPLRFSEEAILFLQGYDWQGNIRQLRNVLEWSLIMNAQEENSEITSAQLPPEIYNKPKETHSEGGDHTFGAAELMSKNLRDARQEFEKQYLQGQIDRFDGNISRTARFVGMERSALHRKIKSLGLVEEDSQDSGKNSESHVIELNKTL